MEDNNQEISIVHWDLCYDAAFVEVINNKKVQNNLRDGIPYPFTIRHSIDFINEMQTVTNLHKGFAFPFAILLGDQLVGSISAFRRDNIYSKTAELGYFIAEKYWGMGITSVAIKLICEHIFENSDIVRIFSETFDYNKASSIVLEKAGFLHEGVLRGNAFKNGEVLDMNIYSMIRSDMKK